MLRCFNHTKTCATPLFAPTNGEVIPLQSVSDPVFAGQMMGDGFAVLPQSGTIFSPVSGTVEKIFSDFHALVIRVDAQLSVLIHLGIDTVELGGEGFVIQVEPGQQVTPETVLAKMDLDFIEETGKATDVICVFPDESLVIDVNLGQTEASQMIGSFHSL